MPIDIDGLQKTNGVLLSAIERLNGMIEKIPDIAPLQWRLSWVTDAVEVLLEVLALGGSTRLSFPSNGDELWEAKMQDARDELAEALANCSGQ